MAISILAGRDKEDQAQHKWYCENWRKVLLALDSSLDIRIWPDIGNPVDTDFVLVWKHPLGALKQFPHAKAIQSLGAGVDHVLVDPDLYDNVPIVRVTDPYMANDIAQYVIAYVLQYVKLLELWDRRQKQNLWSAKEPPFNLSDKSVGIMGMGFLGAHTAKILNQMGLKVYGWSQSPKNLSGIKCYVGETEFKDFLAHSDILVCMLPLTTRTENILNSKTFSYLPKGAYLINVGRGQHLVEEDLLPAIESGQLSGACLDVFRQEPLPPNHPFWSNSKIHVTPHIASVTNAATAAPQVYENYLRAMSGQELLRRVDVKKGY